MPGLRARVARADVAVDLWVERHRSRRWDRVFYPLTSAADHSLLWIAAGALRSAATGRVRPVVNLAAAQGIESFVTNLVVKSWFRRGRPTRADPGPMPYGVHIPMTSSFPSGHATAAFCAAAMLGHRRVSAPAWYLLAAAVAASRVYVRLHHASDVVAGAALGTAFGVALRRPLPVDPR